MNETTLSREALKVLVKDSLDKGITDKKDIETYIVYHNPQYGLEYFYNRKKINMCGTYQCIYPYTMKSEYSNICVQLLK